MRKNFINKKDVVTETIRGIVERVTFHNPENGYSVLRVRPFNTLGKQETVIVHQTKVFAGATMEFRGAWKINKKYGRQFEATQAIEKKPANTAALEKYLGSGLIKGVRKKTAKKIVSHFRENTLNIFEEDIDKLKEVPGIAEKKLVMIKNAWQEHRAIRDVMMFLQEHGISTLFAVRIYEKYRDHSIQYVIDDPYRLASDFYGIGFFSADKVAFSIGIEKDSAKRIKAAIRHVLASSRENGHCYLTETQINEGVRDLIEMDLGGELHRFLSEMINDNFIKSRKLTNVKGLPENCYYSKSLFFDEMYVVKKISNLEAVIEIDEDRVSKWTERFCKSISISLSPEQVDVVKGVISHKFSVLTGGPGCGKTTTTLAIVRLLEAMNLKVLLAAPTGRAAQRMSEVIGREAKTIHRMLGWRGFEFKQNEENPLDVDFLIIDECSMLDVTLTASLLKAIPDGKSYKIGNRSIKVLKGKGIPKEILNKLKTLLNKRYTDKNEFLNDLKSTIGEEITSEYIFLSQDYLRSRAHLFLIWANMLTLSLILKYSLDQCQVLFIGDIDQLPSIGAGNVLKDIINSGVVPCFRLTKIFRQSRKSLIIRYAHEINNNQLPYINSPFKNPELFTNGTDCLFIDSEEATKEQIKFISKVKRFFEQKKINMRNELDQEANLFEYRISEPISSPYETELTIPQKFKHVQIEDIFKAENRIDELKSVLKKIHPWSSLHKNKTAVDMVKHLYLKTIPKNYNNCEIQILSPMTIGSLGAANLNRIVQESANPQTKGKRQINIGERILREGDRVIHCRNNYELEVFNGDIGTIEKIDTEDMTCLISFFPDGRQVFYSKTDIVELDLAYAITIHKSQGSEFDVVIIPLLTQHYKMLFRNLIYTGLTRAKKLAVFVGSRRALAMAVRNQNISFRQTALTELLREYTSKPSFNFKY